MIAALKMRKFHEMSCRIKAARKNRMYNINNKLAPKSAALQTTYKGMTIFIYHCSGWFKCEAFQRFVCCALQ